MTLTARQEMNDMTDRATRSECEAANNRFVEAMKASGHEPLATQLGATERKVIEDLRAEKERLELEIACLKLRDKLSILQNTATIESLTKTTARLHGVPLAALRGPSRSQGIVRIRQELFWRAKHELGRSYPQIGRYFGGRDHTTVLHGVRKHQQRVDAGLV